MWHGGGSVVADTWPVGDPLERGNSGGAGGLFSSFANVIGGGVKSGFGLGDASSGMAAPIPPVRQSWAERVAETATEKVMDQYPGHGILWTYDGGIRVTPAGWAAAAVALWLVIGGR